MTINVSGQNNENIFIRLGNGLLSLIVGSSAFFVIKLIFIVPLNLMTTPDNAGLMESIGAFLIIFAIYLAVKYTKSLNINGTRKSRNIKRVLTTLLGVVCMFISTMFLAINSNISNPVSDEADGDISSVKPIVAVTVIESAKGATDTWFNQSALVKLETIMKDNIFDHAKVQYIERGYDPETINDNFSTKSYYVVIQGKKLAVINILLEDRVNAVYVVGITGNEMIRVSCIRASRHKISLASGICAEEIYSAFGVMANSSK